VQDALSIDDINVSAAVSQLSDYLPARQLRRIAASEDGNDLASAFDMFSEYREESHAAITVGEPRDQI
jgi:hypothetical protein